MSKGLIIVESPTKVKTIQKFVGGDYVIKASVGHIKDLPEGELGVDLEKDFQPDYVPIPGKAKIIRELKKASKDVENIYLGPDPDREGEAIAWHIAEEIGNGKKNIYRVLFNEITKKGVLDALNHPGKLELSKFEAQQARRILDRLVGYQISPLLWEKVRRGIERRSRPIRGGSDYLREGERDTGFCLRGVLEHNGDAEGKRLSCHVRRQARQVERKEGEDGQ